jgi:hypothetical protein
MTVDPNLILWGIIGWAGLLLATILFMVRTVFRLVALGTWVPSKAHERVVTELDAERKRSAKLEDAAEIRADLGDAVSEILKTQVAMLAALPKAGEEK